MRLIKNKSENMGGGYFKVWFDVWAKEKEFYRLDWVLSKIETELPIKFEIGGDGEDLTAIASIREEVLYSEISEMQWEFNILYKKYKQKSKNIMDYEV